MNYNTLLLSLVALASGALVQLCSNHSDCPVFISNGSQVRSCDSLYSRTDLCTEDEGVCTESKDGHTIKNWVRWNPTFDGPISDTPWYNEVATQMYDCDLFLAVVAGLGSPPYPRFVNNFSVAAFQCLINITVNECARSGELPDFDGVSINFVLANYAELLEAGYDQFMGVNATHPNYAMVNTSTTQRSANEHCVLGTAFTSENSAEISFDSDEKVITIQNNGKNSLDCMLKKRGFTLGAKLKPESTRDIPLPAEAYQFSDYLTVRCVSSEGFVTEATFYVPSEEMCIIHGCIQCWELFESLACLPVVWQVTIFILLLIVVLALFSITPCLLPFTLCLLSWVKAFFLKLYQMMRRQSKKSGLLLGAGAFSQFGTASSCDVGGALSGTFTSCSNDVCSASYSASLSLSTGQQACLSNPYFSTKVTLQEVQASYSLTFAYYTSDYHVKTWQGKICQSPYEFMGCGAQSCEHFEGDPAALTSKGLDHASSRHAVHQSCYHKNILACVDIAEGCVVGRTYLEAVGEVYKVFKISSVVYSPLFRIDEFFNNSNHTSFALSNIPIVSNSTVYTVDELSSVGTDDIVGMYYFVGDSHSFIADASSAGEPVAHQFGDLQATGASYLSSIPMETNSHVVWEYESHTSFDNDADTIHFTTYSSPFVARSIKTRVPGGTRIANLVGNETRLSGTVQLSISASLTIESKSSLLLTQVVPNICPYAELQSVEGCYNCEPGARVCITTKSNCDPGLAEVTLDSRVYPVALNTTSGQACFPFQSSTRSGTDKLVITAGNNKFPLTFHYELHYINPNYKTHNVKGKTAEGVGAAVTGWQIPQWAWVVIIVVCLVVGVFLVIVFMKLSWSAAKALTKKNN